MVNGQALPVQCICHTEPYKNYNFQIDVALRYFGVWIWQLVHLLILVYSFQWCVLFLCLVNLYRSCPIHDKGLYVSRSDNVLVLWFRYRLNEGKEELKVKKVYFFWICRDTFAFEWFTDLLKHLEVQVMLFLQRALFYYGVFNTETSFVYMHAHHAHHNYRQSI